MDRHKISQTVSAHLKLVRTEYNHNQDEMAERIGMSKKTLIQVEKGRQIANWAYVVAACAIYQESNTLNVVLGGDPLEIVKTVAHQNINWDRTKTLGGKVWWVDLQATSGFRLQQNIISRHFRILDPNNYRLYSSVNQNYILAEFEKLRNEFS